MESCVVNSGMLIDSTVLYTISTEWDPSIVGGPQSALIYWDALMHYYTCYNIIHVHVIILYMYML